MAIEAGGEPSGSLFLFKFNTMQRVPEYAYPTRARVDWPGPTGETSMARRPLMQRGFPVATLEWDDIQFDAFDWWAQWVNENSAPIKVTSCILPTVYRRQGQGDVRYGHRNFGSAYLTRIYFPGDHSTEIRNENEYWEIGKAVVQFLELGGVE